MRRNVMINFGALALAGGAVAVLAQDRPTAPIADPSARARLDLASETYRRLLDESAETLIAPPAHKAEEVLSGAKAEELYRWSRRWMEARRDHVPDSQRAAIEEHRDRMKSLEEGWFLKEIYRRTKQPVDDREIASSIKMAETGEGEVGLRALREFTHCMRFFRLEAESWLARGVAPGLR